MFSAGTLPKNSTVRELKAILFAIESFKKLLSGARVKWYTDNQAACHIFKKGSMKPYLQDLALDLFTSCLSNRITVDIQWIPRIENQEGDAINKMTDHDYWETTQVLFQYLNDIWDPHTIDRFADNKMPKFFALTVDSRSRVPKELMLFLSDWSNENNYLVPPVHLITRVIYHVILTKSTGILIVPWWPSAPF